MAAEQANNHRPKEIVCAPSRKNMTEGKASMQDMMDNQVPIHVRDDCAGVLIPLNQYVGTLHCIAALFNVVCLCCPASQQVQKAKHVFAHVL
jgi:hypothetical protein